MEYDNNNKGGLWLADKLTKNNEQYYTGNIVINNKEYKLSAFINTSDNPKAPKFKLTVNIPKEDIQESPKEDPFEEFSNLDLPF